MEMGCIGFLLGALVCLVFTGIGVCFGRSNKEQPDPDSDMRLYVFNRYRNRGGDKRDRKPTSQEIEDVLFILRLGASDHEKWVIDYLIDKEEKE